MQHSIKINLINNWKQLYFKLWSNRLMLVAAVFSGVEAGIQIYMGGEVWRSLLIFAISFGATIARMIPQPGAVQTAEKQAQVEALDKVTDTAMQNASESMAAALTIAKVNPGKSEAATEVAVANLQTAVQATSVAESIKRSI